VNDYHERVFDAQRGRKPISEVWLDQGWAHRSTWAIALPSFFPPRTTLVVHEDARGGLQTLTIEGFDVTDHEDGA
jgi:hypothetical protein